ncbi:MAG TPA: dodecin family protein [Candidatus Limnocylindria bacterium]
MLGFMTKERRGTDEKSGHDGKKPEKYEDLLDDGVDVMPVVKIIEVVGTSTVSFEDAVAKGVDAAAKSLRHMSGADVKHLTVAVKNGKVTQYRADLKIAFAIEPDADDDDDD